MTKQELTGADPAGTPALGESKGRVLDALQNASSPLGVNEVATHVHLHPNTTRFHLDALVEAGLADRVTEERDHPGRPRSLYSASTRAARTGRRSFRLLAQILTSYLASEAKQPEKAALTAGEVWGHYLAERPAPFQRVDAAAATQQLVDALDDIGFAPEAVTKARSRRVLLHHCPFREAAEQHSEVVCSVHLGLMRGLLAETGAPVQVTRLDPFVEPTLCVTHLESTKRARASAGGQTD